MKAARKLTQLSVLALITTALTGAPAGADHIPSGSPGAGSHSQNMHFKANVPTTGFTNSDLAFWGNLAFAGNYNGFRVFDISDPEDPTMIANVVCPGPQNDISVWEDVVVISVDTVRTSSECDSAVANPQTLETGWEGVRVFDVSDPTNPQQVGSVYTDCGSHTHTIVPDPANDRLIVYVASYALRSGPDCGPHDDPSDDHDPLHAKISVVEVPLGDPGSASLLSTPPIDVPTWDIADQIGPNPAFNPMQGCHDIQVDLDLDLAAAACAGVGQLWDISDPANPNTLGFLWEADEPEVDFYHSALFSDDGDTVIFGDEIIAGTCSTPDGDGQLWFYDTGDGTLLGEFQIPRDQGTAYCSSHLFNNIPGVRGDVLVAAWYAGGTTIVDYTDPSAAKEIGFYDPDGGSAWSSYWYNNFIFSNDIPLGFNVFLLSDKARAGAHRLPYLNPQVQ